MDRFSIIVPQIGAEDQFENTLASVLSTRPPKTEVIVVHDGTYEDPYDLGREVTFVAADRPTKKLTALLNKGLEVATGQYLAILRPGVQLNEHWDTAIENAFDDTSVGCVSLAITRQDKPAKIVAAGVSPGMGQRRHLVGSNKTVGKRSAKRLAPLGPTLWAGVYRREVLEQIRPLDEQLDANYTDLDIAMAMQTMGYDCRLVTDPVVTTNCAAKIISEAAAPHGKSAQRALVRHGIASGIGVLARTLVYIVGEIVRSPLNPALLNQALSRFSAFGSRRVDQKFYQHVSTVELETAVDRPTSVQFESEAPLRRAA